ncbi:MAG: glycosyl hydrolase [Bryobacteraceae bacterium]
MKIRRDLTLCGVARKAEAVFEASAAKIDALEQNWNPANGSPVFTIEGKYTSRGWTEWTQGFQFGSAILQFDATEERRFLEMGRTRTVELMAKHLTHTGVHDHGFNNISTYGNLLRLWHEKRLSSEDWERHFYEVALKCSGAVQAARWSPTASGGGYIYSFNGPHSLFVDTIRSLRSLAAAHILGHVLMSENDRSVSLLSRLIEHARTTALYSVYYGEGRDVYDRRGRVAHECIFNPNDGNFRCSNSQQGYSAFSTWTRGLAWAICGFAEQLEFIEALDKKDLKEFGAKDEIRKLFVRAAEAASDFYIENSAADGIPYWDTGAPGLANLGDWREREADPLNEYEPVDSSAAVIAAQGFLRLGRFLNRAEYWQAGLTIAAAAFDTPYLSIDRQHQGLILHAIYHRPNGWDHIPQGRKIPCGEACMWGDYHARELALYILRLDRNQPYLTFWSNSNR